MGLLVNETSGLRVALGTRCLVGRSAAAHLRLSGQLVSAEHASIYFAGGRWRLRDLASRNGTFLDAERVAQGDSVDLHEQSRLMFGGRGDIWRLEDASPPGPCARNQRGDLVRGEGMTLWLPDSDCPDAVVLAGEREWTLEHEDQLVRVQDGESVVLQTDTWRLELPPLDDEELASTYQSQHNPSDSELQLLFRVSSDREHIQLEASAGGSTTDLGARAHNLPLLMLASLRLVDQEQGELEYNAGWVYPDELEKRLGLEREAMNLQLWRARQCFRKAKLPAERLIERREDTRQLRLGVGNLVVEPPERRLV